MSGHHQTLALLLFSAFIAVTLGITTWVSRNRRGSAEEFYAGGRLFSPLENGFAIAGDYMSRMSERPVRIAAGTSSVTVSVLYLVAQMVGAGSLVALLLGGTSEAARSWTVIGVGALMVIDVAVSRPPLLFNSSLGFQIALQGDQR